MYSAEPLPRFVDEYLGWLHETHPTNATFDGVHAFDDLIDDLSRTAVDTQARELGNFARRLAAIDQDRLTPDERIEYPLAEASIRSRLHEIEDIRPWERDPHFYAELLATNLASQALFSYAPVEERARREMSKLRQVRRFLQSARDNVKEPAPIVVKIALETLRGALRFVEEDLPRAFADLDDLHLLGDLADASTEASSALHAFCDYLEHDLGPNSRGSFRLGREKFEAKLRLEEGLALPADKLLAIALRELKATQEEFRREASRLDSGDPAGVWQRLKGQHPAAGAIVTVAQQQVDELREFLDRQALVSVPDPGGVIVAETPRFYRWTFASMWTPGPFEPRAIQSYYYVTDVDQAWPPARQNEHLRDFNFGALWAISMHEVFPGHFLHYQHLRRIQSKLRKSILFASASFVEGWAHYAEQMVVEAGFRRGDTSVRLGQLAESLVRLCRVVVGIRLHAEDLSVEQGMRFFRDEAFLEEGSARREAERGAFDPSYVVYSLGKLMLLKLRADCRAAQGARFSLRGFHDTLLGNGHMPFSLHRRQMLGEAAGPVLE
jgi:hypothetical protein